MTSQLDLCVVHNADAKEWRDYIVRRVKDFVSKKRDCRQLSIDAVDDASLTSVDGALLPQPAIVVVILSPAHLSFLRHQHNVNYRTLVDTRVTDALVLRCGTACFNDLASQDSAVFAQFFGWTKLDDVDHGKPITKAVARLLSKQSVAEEDENIYVNPEKILSGRNSTSSSCRLPSTTSETPSNRSSGGWSTTCASDSVFRETADDVSHFWVIPTTIRCEVSTTVHIDTVNNSFNKQARHHNNNNTCTHLQLLLILSLRLCASGRKK